MDSVHHKENDILSLPKEAIIAFINNTANKTGLSPQSIEKDLWVTAVLRAIHLLPYSDMLSFKGGTSLSKGWHLIKRFSEDIDIAIDKRLLGFEGELSKNQISDKLRRASCSFIQNTFSKDIKEVMLYGLDIPWVRFGIEVEVPKVPTADPLKIVLNYTPLCGNNDYIQNNIIIEASGRSYDKAIEDANIDSIVKETLGEFPIFGKSFCIRTVIPERTYIEKICLLHEEFKKPEEKIRHLKMSRHLYDLFMMQKNGVGERAIQDTDMFIEIVKHRFLYTRIEGVDYNTESPGTFNICPNDSILPLWERDYNQTIKNMLYGGEQPSFTEIIDVIKDINLKLNSISWPQDKTPHFTVPGEVPGSIEQKENSNSIKRK